MRRSLHEGLDQILDAAYLTNHDYVKQFESEFAKWNQSKHTVAFSNGTTALQCLLEAVGVKGGEVLIPTNTFIATAKAVISAGAKPVLIDIEQDFLSLDVDQALSRVTPQTKAIVIVHIAGLISQKIFILKKECQKRGIALIEDCAQAHGASRGGVRVGNFGDGGAFSFFLTKIMTMGEGGAVVTDSSETERRLKSLRQFGVDSEFPLMHGEGGGNFKLSEFSALFGTLELKRVHTRIQRRVHLAKIYQNRLADTTFKTFQSDAESFCPHYKQVVTSNFSREQIAEHLSAKGISLTGGVYFQPLHRQPALKDFVKPNQDFVVANQFAERHFCPPCYPELSDDDVHRVCDVLVDFEGSYGS